MNLWRRWSGFALALLSPLFPGLPGLGQFLQGRLAVGAAFALAMVAANLVALDTGLLNAPSGGRIWLAVLFLFWLLSSLDAAVDRTRRRRAGWESSALAIAALIAFSFLLSSPWGLVRLAPVSQIYTMSRPFLPPMLEPGDHVVVSGRPYRDHPPQRGDVVVVRGPSSVAPRFILAIPGDQLYIHGGHVYINGVDIQSPGSPPDFGPKQVPPGTYFVLGDPDGYSAIAAADIAGQARYILWSLSNPARTGRPVP